MARKVRRVVARATPKPKRWTMFESVVRNAKGKTRLYDKARVTLTRNAMHKVTGYEYRSTPKVTSNPWRRKAR